MKKCLKKRKLEKAKYFVGTVPNPLMKHICSSVKDVEKESTATRSVRIMIGNVIENIVKENKHPETLTDVILSDENIHQLTYLLILKVLGGGYVQTLS